MIVSTDWLTLTRETGIASYGIALVCCGIAWATEKRRRSGSRLPAWLTLMEALLLLDMLFNWRWRLHQSLMDEAGRQGLYGARRVPQELVLGMVVALFVLGLALVLRVFRRRAGALLAAAGGLLSLLLWCSEVISLHAVDSILERSIGRWMLVSFMWVLACLMTSIGIVSDARQRSRLVAS